MGKIVAILALALIAFAGFAQTPAESASPSSASGALGFAAGLNLGTDVLITGYDASHNPIMGTWSRLGFQPDLHFGKFGVGLDLTVHFQLYPSPDQAVSIYPGDWIPDYNGSGKSFFDLYLAKILYVRYGLKGEDSFYVKLGSINNLTLGDGFVMDDYSNMLFLPTTRIFGLDLGLDGNLFGFPYVGFELVTGNLARLDVSGGRVYVRPLAGTSIPILKDMQVGGTLVVDTNPYLYSQTETGASPVAVFGGDVLVPIIGGTTFPLAAFADMAVDPNKSLGTMIGAGGRLLSVITYGAQLRFLQDGFIPSYFDTNYDIYRAQKYDYMQNTPAGSSFFSGWLGSLGLSVLKDAIALSAELDGPFAAIPAVATTNQTDYPHAKAVFTLAQGVLGGFFIDASYEKYYLGQNKSFFQDLIDPTNAVVGMDINYKTGASVLTLAYNAKWQNNDWVVTSSISASMQF
jgi:hypothetical protein